MFFSPVQGHFLQFIYKISFAAQASETYQSIFLKLTISTSNLYLWSMSQNTSGGAERFIFMTLHRGCWGVLLKWHFLPAHSVIFFPVPVGGFLCRPVNLTVWQEGHGSGCVSNCEVQFWWKCSLWSLHTLEIWWHFPLCWTTKRLRSKGLMIFHIWIYLAQYDF